MPNPGVIAAVPLVAVWRLPSPTMPALKDGTAELLVDREAVFRAAFEQRPSAQGLRGEIGVREDQTPLTGHCCIGVDAAHWVFGPRSTFGAIVSTRGPSWFSPNPRTDSEPPASLERSGAGCLDDYRRSRRPIRQRGIRPQSGH